MKNIKKWFLPVPRFNLLLIVFLAVIAFLPQFETLAQRKDIRVHDPVMIKQDSMYYLFCTGRGIAVWSSKDMETWNREERVFSEGPQWALEAVEGFRGHIWAPDIAYYNGKYYLYYSISSFGKNTSCIGVATNTTLHPDDPGFEWVDHGKVIQSFPGKTNWNAIDPNLIVSEDGQPYMSFGSFWNGLKLVQLGPNAMNVVDDLDDLPTIASRRPDPTNPDSSATGDNPVDAGPNAIEAPFIFKKGDYYYLFASIDYCCRGARSTYKMIVGRSEAIPGPYLDKQGRPLAYGGGSILLQGDENWHGVGHNAAYTFDGKDYLIFHGYDANDEGRARLVIREMSWTEDGWPEAEL